MQEYEQLGHMREVKVEKDISKMNYFLTHHGIYRPEKSTTKVRVVFNASSPTYNGLSLNDIQLNGGVIQDDLYAEIVRFRTSRYALTADIKKTYRMILIDSEQRCLQQILWKDNKHDRVKSYEPQTVTFRMTSAPYLAQRTLSQLSYDEENKFPVAAPVLRS
ncbi:integrase catalytic domain-containing protein [Trichonephila clavipes]|nr:integrase catalytic domain-containing protein [Trichonephila clavipes]